jgi:hypothetical protein
MHSAGYELADSNKIFQRCKKAPVLNGPWQIGKESIAKLEWALRFGEFGQGVRSIPRKTKEPFKKIKRRLVERVDVGSQETLSTEERTLERSSYESLDSGEFTVERIHLCQLWSPQILRRLVR